MEYCARYSVLNYCVYCTTTVHTTTTMGHDSFTGTGHQNRWTWPRHWAEARGWWGLGGEIFSQRLEERRGRDLRRLRRETRRELKRLKKKKLSPWVWGDRGDVICVEGRGMGWDGEGGIELLIALAESWALDGVVSGSFNGNSTYSIASRAGSRCLGSQVVWDGLLRVDSTLPYGDMYVIYRCMRWCGHKVCTEVWKLMSALLY